MPPTIQTNVTPERENRPQVSRPQRPVEKRSELVCRVKYCNTLPDIPFDPKFITYPFETTRFIQYKPTSLERNYKYEVLTEHDLGVMIDLINRDTYATDYRAHLDPADEKLLEEDILTPQDSKRTRQHAKSVSWLRRTEYISTETTRFQPQTMDKVEAKVGYSIKKSFKDETIYMDRDSQIKAIEKTFKDSKDPIEKHYCKPNVVPVEVLPVYPDFKLWKYPCAQVIFDSDPAPVGRPFPAQLEEMSQAMIRGVMDESGEQFVAYFLPTPETLEKRKKDFVDNIEYTDDQEYEYKMAREYNWNVKSKASKGYEENYFFVVRNDGVYFNELETRVRLNKRRQKPGQQANNTRLVVKHVPLSANEYKMQRYREKQLEPPNEEEEEEEDEEEEEEEEQIQTTTRPGDKNKSDDKKDDKSDNEASGSDHEDYEKQDKSDNEGQRKRRQSGSDDEEKGGDKDDAASSASSKSRSRSSSASRSRSRSRSKSRSRSRSKSKSRSRSRSKSKSRSRSKSKSRSRSRSKSKSRSRSRSKSRSRSRSRSKSKSRSVSKSKSRSVSKSKSRSVSKSKSRSRSRSKSKSKSRSPSRSRSRSASKSSKSRSRSASPVASEPGSAVASPATARSRSRSRSKSQSRSRSRSPQSGSGSGSGSGSSSDSGSASDSDN